MEDFVGKCYSSNKFGVDWFSAGLPVDSGNVFMAQFAHGTMPPKKVLVGCSGLICVKFVELLACANKIVHSKQQEISPKR